MQIQPLKGNIVEKVLRDKEGKLFRAKFHVYENAGRVKARLLEVVYLAEQVLISGASFVLSGWAQAKAAFSRNSYSKIVLNFEIVSEILYSFGSKPRAPTI